MKVFGIALVGLASIALARISHSLFWADVPWNCVAISVGMGAVAGCCWTWSYVLFRRDVTIDENRELWSQINRNMTGTRQ